MMETRGQLLADSPGRPSRAISRHKRLPMRKALVIGCTYQGSQENGTPIKPLLGSVNDAYLFAIALVNLWEFHPNDICLLTDALPANCYSSNGFRKGVKLDQNGMPMEPQAIPRDARNGEATKAVMPTRHNILMGLNWLMGDLVDGDIIVFYFSGYGVQIDNMSGWVGEGYDEAIVPLDYRQLNAEINAISMPHLREQLTTTSDAKIQLDIFMDCCGAQTLLDPCGTNKSWPHHHIKGAKTKGLWLISNVSDKVLRAEYKASLMRDPQLYDRYARPRYIPGEEVGNTQTLRDFSLQLSGGVDNTSISGYQFSAAEWSQLAIEACLPSVGIRGYDHHCVNRSLRSSTATVPQVPVIHGAFTYCLVNAMQHCVHSAIKQYGQKIVTIAELSQQTTQRFLILKKNTLNSMDQVPSLTVYSQGKSDPNKRLFWPDVNGNQPKKYHSYTSEKVKSSPIPYIPDECQWMNAHFSQNIVMYWESKRRTADKVSTPPITNAQILTPPHPYEHPVGWVPIQTQSRRFLEQEPEPGDGKFETGVFSVKKSRGLCQLDN
eukprot:GHVH01008849.1.p1 GENE.GHVH01008849.1~~GHVH01008849.1.p1  ORF type:complete len:548 (+),score=60.49 GHVH01008849.1:143-1786(+)